MLSLVLAPYAASVRVGIPAVMTYSAESGGHPGAAPSVSSLVPDKLCIAFDRPLDPAQQGDFTPSGSIRAILGLMKAVDRVRRQVLDAA